MDYFITGLWVAVAVCAIAYAALSYAIYRQRKKNRALWESAAEIQQRVELLRSCMDARLMVKEHEEEQEKK